MQKDEKRGKTHVQSRKDRNKRGNARDNHIPKGITLNNSIYDIIKLQ